MLIIPPKEMLLNKDCYRLKDGKYIPTEIATDEEKRAIEGYNRRLKNPRRPEWK